MHHPTGSFHQSPFVPQVPQPGGPLPPAPISPPRMASAPAPPAPAQSSPPAPTPPGPLPTAKVQERCHFYQALPPEERAKEVCRLAGEIYQKNTDWVLFFREVLGLRGIVRQIYNTPEALAQFEQTPEYEEIQHMLARLREKSQPKPGVAPQEPTRVITVRLPKSLHEALRAEAHEKRTSMNKLCISKLLQMIDQELVPAEA